MARPRKSTVVSTPGIVPSQLISWAEALGESLGRGVARGINSGLGGQHAPSNPALAGARRRGRPPKAFLGAVADDRRCKVAGCPRPARSKGLCSAHYQADRRRKMTAKA